MERLRFSIHLQPRFSDETPRMAHGVADFGKLFLHTARAPQGGRCDWITWFAHHHLPLMSKTLTARPEVLRTTAFSGWGVAADDGFLTAILGKVGDVEEQALHWTSREQGGLRAYTDPQGRTVTPDHILHLQPHTLAQPNGARRWYASTTWDNDSHNTPNDIDWANVALAVGGVADGGATAHDAPFFDLCALLPFMELPNGAVFPKRSNMTGWSGLYHGVRWSTSSVSKGVNTALSWLFAEGVLRPADLFSTGAFAPGQMWDEAEIAARTHPARALGAALVPIAERHVGTMEAAKAAILAHYDSNPSYPTDGVSAHARVAWIALVQDIHSAGHRLGLF